MSSLPLTPIPASALTIDALAGGTLAEVQASLGGAPAGPVTSQLGAGSYTGATGVTLSSGSVLAGRGVGVTILRNTGTGNTLILEGLEHVTRDEEIRDLTLYSQNLGDANAGIYAHLTQGVIVRHVQATRHKYGLYTDSGEQFSFYDCWFDTCTVAAAWLTGSSPGVYTSNYHKFYNCIFQGAPYGVVIENASGNVAFFNCPFYTNTGPAVYVPSTALGVVVALFENCWFENNTKSLDLRAGSGFTFRNCSFFNAISVVEAANFNHPGLHLDGCNDGGNVNGYLVTAGADYKLTNANPGYPRQQCQIAGKYEAPEYPPTRGSGEKALALPTDMSTWAIASVGVSRADPYGGSLAWEIGVGSSAVHELTLAGGAQLTGHTYTLQIRVKQNGGRIKLQLVNSTHVDVVAAKWVGLPLNDWRFVYYTFTWPTVTDTAAFIYVTAETAVASVYWPMISESPRPIPELTSGRDMSGWVGDYEVFGVNHNVRVSVNNAAPAAGAWLKGDEAVNYNPAAGGTDRWRCTTAGTPGTWKAVAVAA